MLSASSHSKLRYFGDKLINRILSGVSPICVLQCDTCFCSLVYSVSFEISRLAGGKHAPFNKLQELHLLKCSVYFGSYF